MIFMLGTIQHSSGVAKGREQGKGFFPLQNPENLHRMGNSPHLSQQIRIGNRINSKFC